MGRGTAIFEPATRRPLATLAALAFVVLVVVAVQYAGDASPGQLDRRLTSVMDFIPQSVARFVEALGDPVTVVVLASLLAAACFVRRRPRLAVLSLAGPGLTGLVTTVLKHAVGRTFNGDLAYPSGHTAAVTALALVASLLLLDVARFRGPSRVLLLLGVATSVAAVMAAALVGLGSHYPTDTFGGFCTAVAVVPVTAFAIDGVADRCLLSLG